MIGRIFTLSYANKLLDFVHFSNKFMVTSIKELELAFLANELFIFGLCIEIVTDVRKGWNSSRECLKASNLLITWANLLVKKEDVIFKLTI